MSKFKKILGEKIDGLPKNKLNLIPSSYQIVGKILLVKLNPELKEFYSEIGKAILTIFPRLDSVFVSEGISGKLRKPDIIWIAGKKSTKTIVTENYCKFKIDVSEVMFSKGNQFEKRRVVSQIKKGEIVLDMFAGIGYFTIPMAKLSECEMVYAVDLNPVSIKYLTENAELNKVKDKIKIFEGDSKEVCKTLGIKFNRISMGYFPNTYDFLEAAFFCSKKGTIIHFHELSKDEGKDIEKKLIELAKKFSTDIKILEKHCVKKYSPSKEHFVIDFRIEKLYK